MKQQVHGMLDMKLPLTNFLSSAEFHLCRLR